MSARPVEFVEMPSPGLLSPMQPSDVVEVAKIEQSIYAAPWTEGNFIDSLNAGYFAWVLRAGDLASRPEGGGIPVHVNELIGYFVLMAAVDEAHLLNLSVASAWQSTGHGLFLLRKATGLAMEHNAASVILEVRPSNARALQVYRSFGFREHGLRRRYYPASTQDQQSREDAIVMRLAL